MDIPFYTDIYSFPGPWRHHRHHDKPHFKQTQVIETSKDVIINDATGYTRYIVRLLSIHMNDNQLGFKVEVIHRYPGESDDELDLLLTIPEHGYEEDYGKIKKEFDICVQRYNSLVKAETKDFRDIDIYKDRIGYKKTHPECCMFCKWCKKHDCHCNEDLVLECHNPDNQKKFSYMVDFPEFPHGRPKRYNYGWQKLPWMDFSPFRPDWHREDGILDKIFPKVDPFGKCNSFERCRWRKVGSEELNEFINDENMNDQTSNDETDNNIDQSLSPDGSESSNNNEENNQQTTNDNQTPNNEFEP